MKEKNKKLKEILIKYKKRIIICIIIFLILIGGLYIFKNNINLYVYHFGKEGERYGQLDSIEKSIYDEFVLNKEKLESGEYVIDFGKRFSKDINKKKDPININDKVYRALVALDSDDLDFSYIDFFKIDVYNLRQFEGDSYIKLMKKEGSNNYYIDGINSKEDVFNYKKKLKDIKEKVLNEANKKGNIEEKLKYIHDYVIDTLEYDYDNKYSTIYSAINTGKATCYGYARLFKYLIDGLVPNIYVEGDFVKKSGKEEFHCWNLVKVNGEWYGIDTTIDDAKTLEKSEKDTEEFKKEENESKYRFFMKKGDEFNKEHLPKGALEKVYRFTVPKI